MKRNASLRKSIGHATILAISFGWALWAQASIPMRINYQGIVSVSGAPFDGTGLFKFALLDGEGASVWSNDGASVEGSEPLAAVSLTVLDGVYSVALGDDGLANMTVLTPEVFLKDTLFLRLWFDDGENGSAHLIPDTPIHSVSFAIRAASADSIPDELIEENHLGNDLYDRFTALEDAIENLNVIGLNNLPVLSSDANDSNLSGLGYQNVATLAAPSWSTASKDNEPIARVDHGLVWSGEFILVWGGVHSGTQYLNTGGAYDPEVDQWTRLSTIDAPTARHRHTCVWTGTEMIVWGGIGAAGYLNSGGRYNPTTHQWISMTTVDAPDGRQGHISVWTGDKLLIWGGRNASGYLDDGALYDPGQNEWTTLSVGSPPAARYDAAATWVDDRILGDRLIVFGGIGVSGTLNDGAQLLFSEGSPTGWEPLNSAGAPTARSGASIVWTGNRAIVFGGRMDGNIRNDGAAYTPTNDTWTALTLENTPNGRHGHLSVWTGTEMLILAGTTTSGDTASAHAYQPGNDAWRELTSQGNPVARSGARGAWTGTAVFLFGGSSGGEDASSLQSVEPKETIYLFRKP